MVVGARGGGKRRRLGEMGEEGRDVLRRAVKYMHTVYNGEGGRVKKKNGPRWKNRKKGG